MFKHQVVIVHKPSFNLTLHLMTENHDLEDSQRRCVASGLHTNHTSQVNLQNNLKLFLICLQNFKCNTKNL